MSSDPSQELCPSGGGSEVAISNDIPTMDAETSNGDGAQMLEISGEREVTSSNFDINLEPYVGKEFKSEQEAKAFYNGYARYVGFSIRKGSLSRSARDRAVTSRIFVCSKEGYRRETSTSFNEKGNTKRQMAVTRVGCKAQMWVKKGPSGTWVVKRFQREHNHELTPMKAHLLRSHKNTVDNLKEYIESLKVAGVDISKIQNLFVEEARGIVRAGGAQKDSESEDKKKIQELLAEIQRERRRSAAYRERLLMVLGEMEDHARHLSKQVEDIVNNMKEVEHKGAIQLS